VNDPALLDILRLGARVDCDEAACGRLAEAAARLTAWTAMPSLAEAHGMAPLIHAHLERAGIALPIETRRALLAASVRHRDANQVRFRVLGDVLDAFDRAGIPVVVLKGAALAHILYPAPGLRPLGDIDLLVDPHLATTAQSTLGALGFDAPLLPPSASLVSHHHMPGAVARCEGYLVQVEIHVDAISHDSAGSLSMARLGPTRAFQVNGRPARAMGHADMLYHLCRHAAECASLLRLIWVADLVGYAMRYRDEIPWADLARQRPFVLNALSLLHLVTPLPEALCEHVPPARGTVRGIGVACKPLSEIVRRERPLREVWRDLFDPSDWWLRLHYGVGDGQSLVWHRWIVHPLQVARWLLRRTATRAQPWRVAP
jgi:hypothetical protein